MPADTNLSTEHIKSHLQKYRIHRQRSKDEFLEFFNNFMKDSYHRWDENRSWKRPSSGLDIVAMQNGSNISETSTSFINSYGTAPTQFPSSLTSLGALAPGINTHDFVKEEPSGAAVGQRCQAGRRAPPAGNSKEMGGYALDLFKETEGLLQSLQSLCQEATHGGDYQS